MCHCVQEGHAVSILMSVITPKADIFEVVEKSLLMTQCMDRLLFARENLLDLTRKWHGLSSYM